jgi:hypothetical protein
LVSNARHARCNFQVALLTSERQLSSLSYNLNPNPNQKMKRSLLNKTIHFKTSNHVEIQTEVGDPLHNFDKTQLTYQASRKTTSSHLCLHPRTQTPDKKSSMACLKKVSLKLLILPADIP